MELTLIFIKTVNDKKERIKFLKPWPWGGMIPQIDSTISYGKEYEGKVTKVKWDMKEDKVTIIIKQKKE